MTCKNQPFCPCSYELRCTEKGQNGCSFNIAFLYSLRFGVLRDRLKESKSFVRRTHYCIIYVVHSLCHSLHRRKAYACIVGIIGKTFYDAEQRLTQIFTYGTITTVHAVENKCRKTPRGPLNHNAPNSKKNLLYYLGAYSKNLEKPI